MTFRELLEKALDKINPEAQFAGRNNAIDAVTAALKPLVDELIADTSWERCWTGNPYGPGDPYIQLLAYGYKVSISINFKVKSKKVGKKHSFYGDTTYYLPVAACTTDESLMDKDVVEYFDFLYNTSDAVKEAYKEETAKSTAITQYTELLERYKTAVDEFNNLPFEIRKHFRELSLPTLSYWAD